MRREQRLAKKSDFARLRREGRTWSDRLLVVRARPNGLEVSRFGFSVGKRLGTAVVRNKIKRRLREAAHLSRAGGGWDLIVTPRGEAATADFRGLKQSMTNLLRRVGVAHTPAGRLGDTPGAG